MAETLLPFDYRPFSSGIRFTKTIYIYREMSVAWFGVERVGCAALPPGCPPFFSLLLLLQGFNIICAGVLYPQAFPFLLSGQPAAAADRAAGQQYRVYLQGLPPLLLAVVLAVAVALGLLAPCYI